MADSRFTTSDVPTSSIGNTVDQITNTFKSKRVNFERRWYDNNFFDDGYHYRFYSKQANRIIDVSANATLFNPMRAIPKASRQIRGVANLLIAPDYVPVVYPEKIDMTQYPTQKGPDGKPLPNPMYDAAMKKNKDIAHKSSRWLTKEWEDQDLIEKIAHMVILAAKHGVSWMQVWPDAIEEKIRTQVFDAFDILIDGSLTDPYDSPAIIKITPQLISQIKANENFDEEQLAKITPDNRFASSEIKEAYMSSRYNKSAISDHAATLLLKEAFIKEYLNEDNMPIIRAQDDGEAILKGRKKGDQIIRQVFVAGNIWLRDRYVNLPEYPFVDFRFEPGPIYQVPLIERFIPQNKSLDALVSRAERYSHTMVTGSWSQRAGESFDIQNDAGGLVYKYQAQPPIQNQIAPLPSFFFELMGLMGSLIEEQGVSLTTTGKLPTGVKGHEAIESLKESEYANLVMASRRLKGTVKRIAEKFFDAADNHFVTPQTVYDTKDGNPNYFDVIGASALEGRKKLKVDTSSDIVPLKKDYKCEIEVEQGMAYTQQGKKQAAKDLGDYMVSLSQINLLDPNVVKLFIKKLLEVYQFGPTEDIMEAMDQALSNGGVNEDQVTQMKIAVLQALQDAGEVGDEASKKRVMENKVGVLEALKDTGALEQLGKDPKAQAEIAKIQADIQIEQEEHQLKMEQMRQEMRIAAAEAGVQIQLDKTQASHNMVLKQATTEHGMKIKQQIANKPTPKPTGGSNGK